MSHINQNLHLNYTIPFLITDSSTQGSFSPSFTKPFWMSLNPISAHFSSNSSLKRQTCLFNPHLFTLFQVATYCLWMMKRSNRIRLKNSHKGNKISAVWEIEHRDKTADNRPHTVLKSLIKTLSLQYEWHWGHCKCIRHGLRAMWDNVTVN